MSLNHYSVREINELKKQFVDLAQQNDVVVVYGLVELEGKHQLNPFIKVDANPEMEWEGIFKKVGKSANPVVVINFNYFEEEDFDALPDKSEVTRDALGDNYEVVKKKIKDFETVLKDAKVDDLTSFDITVNLGNYIIEQSFYSVLSEIKFFELDDYVEDDEDEVEEEEPKVPTKAEMKQIQEKLKALLLADPMLLNCTNKGVRQSFLREKIDEMGLNESTAYYVFRDSQHIVELAFAQAKNSK